MAESVDSLEWWAVATFNVVTFSLGGVLIGHASGALTDSLPSFGTLPGVAVFGYLWLLTLGATRWALPTGGLAQLHADGARTYLRRGSVAGGLVGMGFVGGVTVVASIVSMGPRGPGLTAVALITLLGAAVATVVGLLLGGVFTLLTVTLFRTAR